MFLAMSLSNFDWKILGFNLANILHHHLAFYFHVCRCIVLRICSDYCMEVLV